MYCKVISKSINISFCTSEGQNLKYTKFLFFYKNQFIRILNLRFWESKEIIKNLIQPQNFDICMKCRWNFYLIPQDWPQQPQISRWWPWTSDQLRPFNKKLVHKFEHGHQKRFVWRWINSSWHVSSVKRKKLESAFTQSAVDARRNYTLATGRWILVSERNNEKTL